MSNQWKAHMGINSLTSVATQFRHCIFHTAISGNSPFRVAESDDRNTHMGLLLHKEMNRNNNTSVTFAILCASLYVSFGINNFTAFIIFGLITRKQAHKIAAQHLSTDACITVASDARIRKMMLIVVVTFYVSWTPFIVIAVLVCSIGFQMVWMLVLMEFAETLFSSARY